MLYSSSVDYVSLLLQPPHHHHVSLSLVHLTIIHQSYQFPGPTTSEAAVRQQPSRVDKSWHILYCSCHASQALVNWTLWATVTSHSWLWTLAGKRFNLKKKFPARGPLKIKWTLAFSDVLAPAWSQKPGQAKPKKSQAWLLAWAGFWPGLGYRKAKAVGLSPGFCTLGIWLKFAVRARIFSIFTKIFTLKHI